MGEVKFSPFQIMHIPQRKKPCLFVFEQPNAYIHVATFRNEESAKLFAKRFNEVINEILEMVGKADDRENVKGVWKWRYDNENGQPVYGCSYCNERVIEADNREYIFCPYCGADMRGEQDDK